MVYNNISAIMGFASFQGVLNLLTYILTHTHVHTHTHTEMGFHTEEFLLVTKVPLKAKIKAVFTT